MCSRGPYESPRLENFADSRECGSQHADKTDGLGDIRDADGLGCNSCGELQRF